jgi:isocitrate dehydrogenase
MGKWEATSRTQVSTMTSGDFYANEQSKTWKTDDTLQIEHIDLSGKKTLLKSNLSVKSRDILDATCLDVQKLRDFFNAQFEYARSQNLLISLHLKATMMKVSDPVIFGHAVSVYLDAFIQQHHALLDTLGWNPNNGIQDLENKLKTLPSSQSETLISELQTHVNRFPLAMVNSEKGITNLHVPSDVIVDASMPAMIRDSGKMWNAKGERQETNALIPDRSYAGIYQVVINDCKKNGAFDPSTMGSVPNVGLMAQKAEEYGSHDKTFIAPSEGKIQVRDTQNQIVFEHSVHAGDIWRMCQTKDAPIRDWVKLAVNRATLSQTPAIFWLDPNRAHDQEVAQKVTAYLEELNTQDADIRILSPLQATEVTLDRIRKGLDTISVSGNVLRDYLTDLFPILELGTSAKMLSIVPLMNGGGLFETGAGGSAPKLAQQFIEEGHLRWDSLGEFLALSASLEHMANTTHHNHASVFSETLDTAIECSLSTHKTPGHDSGTLDNRGTHFYLALFWAKALSEQTRDLDLQAQFKPLYEVLSQNEALILDELTQCQGKPQDIKGYYRPNPKALNEAMRPSTTFNHILENN